MIQECLCLTSLLKTLESLGLLLPSLCFSSVKQMTCQHVRRE